ncbi:HAMP domain-containing sensor histidine kinase [Actinomycetes bacterium KLBMP 9797]
MTTTRIGRVWTVRTRLALLFGALFLLGGTVLLGLVVTLVNDALADQPVNRAIVAAHRSQWEPTDEPPPNVGAAGDLPPPSPGTNGATDDSYRLAESLQDDFRRAARDAMFSRGAAALVGVAVIGGWLGWLAAGRTLRPIGQITATARRIADDSMHQRVALAGPRDELRELGDTFDEMLARLGPAFDGQRLFVANASHELKTPLTISRTLLEVALTQPDVPPGWRRLCTDLLEVNGRQERLLDGLLTLARFEHAILAPVPVDLAAVVREIAAAVADRARVSVLVDAAPALALGDPTLLERLVQNLVHNAVQHNVPDGEVQVASGTAAAGAWIRVANTGPVVARDEIDGLFEPFRRLGGRGEAGTGSGLGLSIVRSVVRVHGGAVTAEPGDRGGLVVRVTLPAAHPNP